MREDYGLSEAISDFREARSKAVLQELLGRVRGESVELLSYEEVRQMLRASSSAETGLRDIPLDAIIGSVGRYTDFTRSFLPRDRVNEERWARVKLLMSDQVGLPPIEVYKIGEAYFVKDGNHRVSVARQLGATHIQAYVTEVRTRVPINPDIQPDELILKAEYANFLEQTHLDELRPEADLSVTIPGQYPILLEHISVHRYFIGIEQKREIPYEEAVTHWFDSVYLPTIRLVRESGILRYFPGRTETDLYLWLAKHRAELEEQLGWQVRPEYAVQTLAERLQAEQPAGLARLGERLLGTLLPVSIDDGPPPGQWRKSTLATRGEERLFQEVLVPVDGKESGWFALEQALRFARREGSTLHGLHVVKSRKKMTKAETLAVQAEFDRRCQEAGVAGSLVIASGKIAEEICARSRLTDLIITTLLYPPGEQIFERLDSGFRELIQRCSRPVLAVPQVATELNHAALAFDGSPKSREALFVAAYLAAHWKIRLSVFTVFENNRLPQETLLEAQVYLDEKGIQAEYRAENGPVSETLLRLIAESQAELVIMGGYGYSPVLEVVLGSTVDHVLRQARLPVLVCR
jgi:nucleotide-binding universal stress UspA family protein